MSSEGKKSRKKSIFVMCSIAVIFVLCCVTAVLLLNQKQKLKLGHEYCQCRMKFMQHSRG